MSGSVSANPNVPPVNQPIADVNALAAVATQLRQGVMSLGGQLGGQLDRAVTFHDLQQTGLGAAVVIHDTNINDLTGRVDTLEQQVTTLQNYVNQLASRSVVAASVNTATPSGTTSAAYVMMGLGLSYRPLLSQRACFIIDGQIANSANAGQSWAHIAYGTGTPPSNGNTLVAVGGITLGQPVKFAAASAGASAPFSQAALLTGLVLGTSYWVDIALLAVSGTASVADVDLTGFGLLDPYVFV